jgi:phosphatidylglycerol:prolipoprotein diacylglycerol transferase
MLIVIGVILAIAIAIKLAGYYKIKKETIIDLSFYLIIFGIIGARIYHVGLEWQYYLKYPLDIFKIWNGGLAIHGAIIAGLIVVYVFSLKKKINFWLLTSLIVPGLSLALAIGRWGNYFNQEIFGYPTGLPWGIPIDFIKRPLEFISAEYFQPTFLYESLGSFVIFVALILFHYFTIKKKIFVNKNYQLMTVAYLVMYSILRFSLEFVRIDRTPVVSGLRWPQITSLIIVLLCIPLLALPKIKKHVNL